MRGLRAALLAVTALAVLAAPTLACVEERFDPAASVIVCGDPRVQSTLDNRASGVPAVYKLKFRSGRDKSPIVVRKAVAAGAIKVTKFRWAHGSRPFVIKVWTDSGWTTLVRQSVRNATPWGEGACPANRFETAWRIAS